MNQETTELLSLWIEARTANPARDVADGTDNAAFLDALSYFANRVRETTPQTEATEDPIDMVLFCPKCGTQHIDVPERESYVPCEHCTSVPCEHCKPYCRGWKNGPHRTHLCLNPACGHRWRPADVPTNGVAAVQTQGDCDSPIVKPLEVARNETGKPVCVFSNEWQPGGIVAIGLMQRQTDWSRVRPPKITGDDTAGQPTCGGTPDEI